MLLFRSNGGASTRKNELQKGLEVGSKVFEEEKSIIREYDDRMDDGA